MDNARTLACDHHSSLVFVFFLLLLPLSLALNIDSYQIAAECEEDSVHITLFIYISNNRSEPVNTATISVPPDSQILSTNDFYGQIRHEKIGPSLHLDLSTPIEQGSRRLILIEILSKEILSSKDSFSEYLLIFNPSQDIEEFEHTFKLPGSKKDQIQFVSPPAEIALKDDNLLVRWKTSPKKGIAQPFIVRFEQKRTDLTPLLIIMSLFILAYAMQKVSSRYLTSKRKDRLIDSLKILNERERVIVEEIIRNKGVNQHYLQHKFGYKKASISKIISRLAYREIIIKKKYGKTNRLFPGKRLK